jgi:hypothetical protein
MMLDERHKLIVTKEVFEIIIDYFFKNVQTNFLNKFAFQDEERTKISSELSQIAGTFPYDPFIYEELSDFSYKFFKTLESHEKTALYFHTITEKSSAFEEEFEMFFEQDEDIKLFDEGKYDEEYGKFIENLINNGESEMLINHSVQQLRDVLINFCSEFDLYDYEENLETIKQTILDYQINKPHNI